MGPTHSRARRRHRSAMKSFAVVIAALCLVQVLEARVTRDTHETNPLEELFNNVHNYIQQLANNTNIPTSEQVQTAFNQGVQNSVESIRNFANQIETQIPQLGESAREATRSLVAEVRQKADEAAAQHPEAAQNVRNSLQHLNSTIHDALAHAQQAQAQLREAAQPVQQSVQTSVQALGDQLQQLLQQLQHDINEASHS